MKRWMWLAGILIVAVILGAVWTLASNGDGERESTNAMTAGEANAVVPEETGAAEYRTLSIEEFADIVENRSDEYQIINVHIPYAGEVENTDANIPFNDLDALTAAIPSKDTPVVLYCRSGNMSEQASRALVAQGYTQVWDVPGGMAAWQASGHDLIG